MGCFNATCIASRLPIQAGEPVRFLAMTQNRWHKGAGHACYVNGRWQLRGPPLRAKYNDYGSVEDIEPGLVERVFFGGFDSDVIEKGVGDNQCHDVHAHKGMSAKEWLSALWEGRVQVDDNLAEPVWDARGLSRVKDGIPNLSRLEKVLRDAGIPVTTTYGAPGCVLDEQSPGFIRVRWGAYGDRAGNLQKPLEVIRAAEYAAMLTAGTGSYAVDAEILVAPAPGVQYNGPGMGPFDGLHRREPRDVAQAMIREDVWQILLRVPLDTYWFKGKVTADVVFEQAQAYLGVEADLDAKLAAMNDPVKAFRLKMERRHVRGNNLFSAMLQTCEGVSGWTFQQSLDLAQTLAKDRAELDVFVRDLCETLCVEWAFSKLHGQWHPSTNDSQDPNWRSVRNFHRRLGKIRGRWQEELPTQPLRGDTFGQRARTRRGSRVRLALPEARHQVGHPGARLVEHHLQPGLLVYPLDLLPAGHLVHHPGGRRAPRPLPQADLVEKVTDGSADVVHTNPPQVHPVLGVARDLQLAEDPHPGLPVQGVDLGRLRVGQVVPVFQRPDEPRLQPRGRLLFHTADHLARTPRLPQGRL